MPSNILLLNDLLAITLGWNSCHFYDIGVGHKESTLLFMPNLSFYAVFLVGIPYET